MINECKSLPLQSGQWANAIKTRDDNTCWCCGNKFANRKETRAHHALNQRAIGWLIGGCYPYRKLANKEPLSDSEYATICIDFFRYCIANGITLCHPCHEWQFNNSFGKHSTLGQRRETLDLYIPRCLQLGGLPRHSPKNHIKVRHSILSQIGSLSKPVEDWELTDIKQCICDGASHACKAYQYPACHNNNCPIILWSKEQAKTTRLYIKVFMDSHKGNMAQNKLERRKGNGIIS